jgi:HSP20 family protein
MELMSKLKEIIPWKQKPVETHQVLSLRDDINRLFDRMLMAPFDFDWERPSRFGGGLDIDETEQGVQARIEVPGLDPKQLHVTTRHGILRVHYEHEDDSTYNGSPTYRYAAFDRTIALPDGVDTSRAEAVCKHGLLTVFFPWRETEEGRRIVVSAQ